MNLRANISGSAIAEGKPRARSECMVCPRPRGRSTRPGRPARPILNERYGLIATVTAMKWLSPRVPPKPTDDSSVSISSIVRDFVDIVRIDNELVGFLEH